MTKAEEQRMLRAVDKLKDNSGRIAKALERIADALEPDVLLESTACQGEALPEIGKVTAEEALAAAKTIRDYCEQMNTDKTKDCIDCGLFRLCEGRFFRAPASWDIEDDDND